MTMNKIISIDSLVREKARSDLMKRLQDLAYPLAQACSTGCWYQGITEKGSFHDDLMALVERGFKQMAPRAEDAAVQAFIEKVDSIQGQIDDLMGQVQP